MKIKKTILTALAGLIISGCANLPNVYRNNLTVDSKEYITEAREEFYSPYNRNLEEKARLSYVLNEGKVNIKDFSIESFEDGKSKIAYSKWKSENSKEVLIFLNGLESHAGWFSEPANELAKRGIVTYGLDRRGSGLNTRIKGDSRDWLRDVDRVVGIAKKENPNMDINLASLCFGSRLATAYAIENQQEINSLIYISPGFDMKVGLNFCELNSIILDCFGIQTNTSSIIKKDEMFTKNPEYLKFLKDDKLRTRKPNSDTYFYGWEFLGKSKDNLDKIKIPGLVLLAGRDKIVDTKKTKKTLQKFGKKPEVIEYLDSQHTIFFDSKYTTTKFIKDMEDFMLR